MNGPPPRFRCPPEFEAEAGGVTVTLGGPQAELWLIRAPADFCPQSLEGCPVPLDGLERLRPPGDGDSGDSGDTGDTGELWVLRGGPGTGDCPLLLSPMSPGGGPGLRPPPAGVPEHRPQLRGDTGDGPGGTWGHRGGTWGHQDGTWGHQDGPGDTQGHQDGTRGHRGGTWGHRGGTWGP
nr:DNA-directed RNA polymerase I subunit RPA34 isoform X2 [Taeniopygia guttata]